MKTAVRILLYIAGLVGVAMGTVLSIRSGLGVASTASFCYVLAQITRLSVGTMTGLTFALFILLQLLLEQNKTERIKILLQLPFSLFFSYMMDILLALLPAMTLRTMGQILVLAASILCTAAGAFLTIKADLVPVAPDGLVHVIADRFRCKLGNVKCTMDIVVLSLALILGFAVLHGLAGIGIGTIVSAFLVGPCINLIEKSPVNRLFDRTGAKT